LADSIPFSKIGNLLHIKLNECYDLLRNTSLIKSGTFLQQLLQIILARQ